MRRRHSRWRRIAGGFALGIVLSAHTGCISLDYNDWQDFNETVVGGAFDATGAFVEDSLNGILTSIFDGLTGMPNE